jgi:hypothetical protein
MMARLLHAEWTKFRTVRGWVIGAFIVVLATVGVGLLAHQSCSINGSACTLPLGLAARRWPTPRTSCTSRCPATARLPSG